MVMYVRSFRNLSYFISQMHIWKFSLGINHNAENMQKVVIIALFIKVKTFKLFLVENFNTHKSRIGKWTPMYSSSSFNNDQYFAYLVFVKNLKPTKCLKKEQLNKLGYIYLECY